MYYRQSAERETNWRQLLVPIIGFLIDDPPDTAAWIGHVFFETRNDVHMSVFDGLPW
jgi:hypothetical protein